MTAEVHRLTGAGPIIEPPEGVVDKLRDLLARAERGEIKGLGVFYVDGANALNVSHESGCASANMMLAGAAALQHRIGDIWWGK